MDPPQRTPRGRRCRSRSRTQPNTLHYDQVDEDGRSIESAMHKGFHPHYCIPLTPTFSPPQQPRSYQNFRHEHMCPCSPQRTPQLQDTRGQPVQPFQGQSSGRCAEEQNQNLPKEPCPERDQLVQSPGQKESGFPTEFGSELEDMNLSENSEELLSQQIQTGTKVRQWLFRQKSDLEPESQVSGSSQSTGARSKRVLYEKPVNITVQLPDKSTDIQAETKEVRDAQVATSQNHDQIIPSERAEGNAVDEIAPILSTSKGLPSQDPTIDSKFKEIKIGSNESHEKAEHLDPTGIPGENISEELLVCPLSIIEAMSYCKWIGSYREMVKHIECFHSSIFVRGNSCFLLSKQVRLLFAFDEIFMCHTMVMPDNRVLCIAQHVCKRAKCEVTYQYSCIMRASCKYEMIKDTRIMPHMYQSFHNSVQFGRFPTFHPEVVRLFMGNNLKVEFTVTTPKEL